MSEFFNLGSEIRSFSSVASIKTFEDELTIEYTLVGGHVITHRYTNADSYNAALQDIQNAGGGSGGSGGTSNYEQLSNLPSINGYTLTGNKTTSDLELIKVDPSTENALEMRPTGLYASGSKLQALTDEMSEAQLLTFLTGRPNQLFEGVFFNTDAKLHCRFQGFFSAQTVSRTNNVYGYCAIQGLAIGSSNSDYTVDYRLGDNDEWYKVKVITESDLNDYLTKEAFNQFVQYDEATQTLNFNV